MNHEKHESDEIHEITGYQMRLASPLTPEEEALMSKTIGCAIEVHKALGPGFLESIYRRAMCLELRAHGIPYERSR